VVAVVQVLQAGEREAPTKPKGRPRKQDFNDEQVDNNNDLMHSFTADQL